MIEQNISINVNENIDVIMNFIITHMDEYVRNGKIKSKPLVIWAAQPIK